MPNVHRFQDASTGGHLPTEVGRYWRPIHPVRHVPDPCRRSVREFKKGRHVIYTLEVDFPSTVTEKSKILSETAAEVRKSSCLGASEVSTVHFHSLKSPVRICDYRCASAVFETRDGLTYHVLRWLCSDVQTWRTRLSSCCGTNSSGFSRILAFL